MSSLVATAIGAAATLRRGFTRACFPVVAVLAALLAVAVCVALTSGAIPISLVEILSGSDSGLQRTILTQVRAPRVLLAGCVGAALAISGAGLQGLFRNPLADPGLIGVSSGAALGAIAMIVLGGPVVSVSHWAPFALPLAAVAGAIAVTAFLYAFCNRYGQFCTVTLLLVGVAVNALAGVGIGLLKFLSDSAELRTWTFWMMGSFGRADWLSLTPAILLMAAAAAALFSLSRNLDRLQLGEAEAFYVGVDVGKLKRRGVLYCAVAVGAGVALSGYVGFVGLMVPHLIRPVVGASHRRVMPGAALLGATLTILADTVARTVVAPAELPVGLVTSAMGAPFFLWLIATTSHR